MAYGTITIQGQYRRRKPRGLESAGVAVLGLFREKRIGRLAAAHNRAPRVPGVARWNSPPIRPMIEPKIPPSNPQATKNRIALRTSAGRTQPPLAPAPNAIMPSPRIRNTAASGPATYETHRKPVFAPRHKDQVIVGREGVAS